MARTVEERIGDFCARVAARAPEFAYWTTDGFTALDQDDLAGLNYGERKAAVLAGLDAHARLDAEFRSMLGPEFRVDDSLPSPYREKYIERRAVETLVETWIRRRLLWTEEEWLQLLLRPSAGLGSFRLEVALQQLEKTLKRMVNKRKRNAKPLGRKGTSLPGAVEQRLLELAKDPVYGETVLGVEVVREYVMLVDSEESFLRSPSDLGLDPEEAWVQVLLERLDGFGQDEQQALLFCYQCAREARTAKPSKTFRKTAAAAAERVPPGRLREEFVALFHAVPKGRPAVAPDEPGRYVIADGGADVLRGTVWILAMDPWPGLAAELADLLVTSVKKLPWTGPRCVKLANACIFGLGEMAAHADEAVRMSALAQLAKLKARVSFKTTLNAIQKALTRAAEAAGVSVEELEELGVPAFGFAGGRLTRTVGGAEVVLSVEGSRVVTQWTNERGRSVKSAPAAVRRDHADEVKELRRLVKDVEAIVAGTRGRLDGLYLRRASWTLDDWRERYLDHGVVGALTRRLIWSADGTAFLPTEAGFEDASGEAVVLAADARVELWHPIRATPDEVLAWRRRIEAERCVQPFKQAHREVYVLTDAERRTEVYSNRFAAHIVKQHQFGALAKGRGWNHAQRLMVDDAYPPTHRELPAHGLRAEFWVEPVGDEFGVDTTETGTYLHLATDQVRFYAEDAPTNLVHATGGGYGTNSSDAPVPVALDAVDALVFSEIMRDVDLFVGVTSVSNDPQWTDGGRNPEQTTYWQRASFGELGATAETRKDLLGRLVPRLAIAERCTLDGRFLVVRGDVRTYKIHLGSGNILMEPNDQYLCIVPAQGSARTAASKVFLPFEGDRTLSLILSKAFLLAEDSKIDDRTILSQIERA